MSTYYVPGTILSALSIISFNGIIEEQQRLTQGELRRHGRNTVVGDVGLEQHGGKEREGESEEREGGRAGEIWYTWNEDKREGRVTCDQYHGLDSINSSIKTKSHGVQKLCLRELTTDRPLFLSTLI